MSMPERPEALDQLLGHVADNLPAEQAEATAKAPVALAALEAKMREHKAQERAQIRRDALLEGADAVFALGFDQCGHGDTEFGSFQHAWDLGTIDAARALRRLARPEDVGEQLTKPKAPAPCNSGPGWYEVINPRNATTRIALVHEDGSLYLPEGEDALTADEFTLAAVRGNVHRLVRADEVQLNGAQP